MTTSEQPQATGSRNWLDVLAEQPMKVARLLFVVAGAFLLIGVLMLIIQGRSGVRMPVLVWIMAVALVNLVIALLFQSGQDAKLTARDRTRALLLTLGGLFGLFTVILGFVLAFSPDYKPVFAAGLKQWREKPQALIWPTLAVVGGLLAMFASLQLARGVERESGIMRRLLYGYNTVLTCVLLLAVLVLVNVLAYVQLKPFNLFSRPFDWTSSGLYEISPATRSMLESLKEPVKVYVLLSGVAGVRETESLLESFRSVSPQITWEVLSRDRNRRRIIELMEEYKMSEPIGLLVVHGTESSERSKFIPLAELLLETEREEGGPLKFNYAGESALYSAITFLQEGEKTKIYFLQGHGELDINERGGNDIDQGMGLLRDRLAAGNYEPAPLTLEPGGKVPEDADVVVVVRPQTPIPDHAVKALRAYLKGEDRPNKGKMMVFLDVVLNKDKIVQTGLEGLLAEYNVKVRDDHVVSILQRFIRLNPFQDPESLLVKGDPLSGNPVGRAFALVANDPTLFWFFDTRSVTSLNEGNPTGQMSPFQVRRMLMVSPEFQIWSETNFGKNLNLEVDSLLLNPEERKARVSNEPIGVAVAVSEPRQQQQQPINPHRAPGEDAEPRLVVFGDASWVSNMSMAERARGPNFSAEHYDLFTSCVSWLRERPTVGLKAKPRTEYTLKAAPENHMRMMVLPGFLMVIGIIGVGLGVWVVRRR